MPNATREYATVVQHSLSATTNQQQTEAEQDHRGRFGNQFSTGYRKGIQIGSAEVAHVRMPDGDLVEIAEVNPRTAKGARVTPDHGEGGISDGQRNRLPCRGTGGAGRTPGVPVVPLPL